MTIKQALRLTFYFVTALLVATLLSTLLARADQRTIYGADGRVIGRETVDSQGTRTLYGSDGRAVTRQSPTGNATTIYDAQTGRQLGTTQDKRK